MVEWVLQRWVRLKIWWGGKEANTQHMHIHPSQPHYEDTEKCKGNPKDEGKEGTEEKRLKGDK